MLKEIFEQPEVVKSCVETYLSPIPIEPGRSPFALNLPGDLYTRLREIHILACGTSLHAGLVGQFLLEQIAGIPTQVRSASESLVAPLPVVPQTLTLGVTQSGETADTLAALDFVQQRRRGGTGESWFLAITNKPQSSIAQRVEVTISTPAGLEVGVAATKTFVAQLMAFSCLALDLAWARQTITPDRLNSLLTAFHHLPSQIETLLQELNAPIEALSRELSSLSSVIFLGTGIGYPIALEGALKLKETSYLHAEGYAAGEFLHGPIAMLDETVPVVVIVPSDASRDRLLTSARKARSYGARLIGIGAQSDGELQALFDPMLVIPASEGLLVPTLEVIPLQLLAYHTAIHRGVNVDKPRHLTKALTG